jgi:O-antigen/teichoic acid export membrane protein
VSDESTKPASHPERFSLFRGAATMTGGRYVAAAFGWVGTLILVRTLSPSVWGEYIFVFSLLGIVGVIGGLQIGRIVLRQIIDAGDAAEPIVSSYVAFRIALGLVVYVIAVLIVWASGYSSDVLLATVVGGTTLILGAIWSSLAIVFEARLSMRPMAVSQALGQMVQLALTVAVAVIDPTLLLFVLAAVVGQLTIAAWRVWAVRKLTHFGLRVDATQWRAWFKESVPLSLGSALETAYFRIDAVMMSKLASLTAVGLYGVGYKFSDLVGSLPAGVTFPMLSVMVRHWPHDAHGFHKIFRRALLLLTVAGVGIGVEFGAFAGNVIVLFYGHRYSPVAFSAVCLMVGQLLNFYTSLCFYTLAGVARYRAYPVAALIGLAVNVGLNLVLIPRYSYNGAGVATIVTELVVVGILVQSVLRVPGVRPIPWMPFGKSAVAGSVMAAVVLGLRGLLPWPAVAVMGGLVYLAALHVIRVDGQGGLRSLADSHDLTPGTSTA